MVIFRKAAVDAISSITPQYNSRVKRIPDQQLSFSLPDIHKNLTRKYFKDGEFYDSLRILCSPSGKMFAVPAQWASTIEIEDLGAESGKILEETFLRLMSEIGVPRRDILQPAGIIPSAGNKAEEFSDGVILFGDTAFLLQMKQRNSTEPHTYASPDKYQTIRRNVEKAKIQYYRSLALARDSNNNMVTMESISGETRTIDIEKYNWVSIIITNRNYFGETDKPLIMDSEMNSPQDFELEHVNHVILTLQGVVNLFNLFSSYYGVLSYWKMLSTRKHKYELCAETSLAFDIYGKNYGLEDNALRFVGLITKAVNQFFNEGTISKSESASILAPLYSNNNQDLEELFVNIENNFTETAAPLFAWDDAQSKYLILLDYAGRISAIANKEVHLAQYGTYRADEIIINDIYGNSLDSYLNYYDKNRNHLVSYLDHYERYRRNCNGYIYPYLGALQHKKHSDNDTHLRISDVDSFGELSVISISVNQKGVDKGEALRDVLEIFKLGVGDSVAPEVLSIINDGGANMTGMDIIAMGDTIFVPQIVDVNIENNYVNSMFSEADDLLTLQNNIYDCQESFKATIAQIKQLKNLRTKDDNGKVKDISFEKYHWVSLLVADGQFTPENIKNELFYTNNPSIAPDDSSTILISMDGLSNVIHSLERNGVIYDFFRRISIRNNSGNLSLEGKLLSDYMEIIENMGETKSFITNFNNIVLRRFNEGNLDKATVRRIFSIFDNLNNFELSMAFKEVNVQIQKSLRISDRFTFSFENSYVFVFFTVCNGLTVKEKHNRKLMQELVERCEAQRSTFIVGILSDIVQNKANAKHAMVTKYNPIPQNDLRFSWNSVSS